ncbi:MAG TPA: tyrosine-protein phosphatase [Pyrinomonadaceae bacterium]|jgi:protein tyrosine/serine phosphatase
MSARLEAGRHPFGRLLALSLFVALLALSSSSAQTGRRDAELPNFHQVNEHLYRGAQPRRGGIQKLKALGIKTIINLREPDESTRGEEVEARAAGLRYFSIPMEGFERPTDQQIDRALALINAMENWPVFVHCAHGKDRTGTVIACYRISHDGWTSAMAKAEAKHYGMSWVQVKMKDYIHDYYKKYEKK